jgi:uncharacterized protein (UPF0218 family)
MNAKVTVQKAEPAAAVSPAATEPETTVVTDSTGRRLTIRQPNLLDESRLVRTMGEAALNAAYMTMYVMPAAMVVAIDGEEDMCPFPVTERMVEAAIHRLGRPGMAAVMKHITESVNPQGDADAIKKLDATPASNRQPG